ncbi:MAG TPA: molecular chaperone HtpG [Gammaproteobacteria bacterium]|jgi:molecular chaperone HtpG
MADSQAAETFGFQAEVKQLLHLMVHSLYSEREIFLRELISNASDANDRLRFEAIENPKLLVDAPGLEISVEVNPEAKTLSVSDSGIGMSREEIMEQLGTIAHSGTGRFLEQLTGDQKKDSQLIGQFGVGFYSAFIVAEEVTVVSRRADLPPDGAVKWVSQGEGEYSIASAEKESPGTDVILTLRDDAAEFLDEYRIRSLILKYSDHVGFPIRLRIAGSDKESEQVNRARALWTRPRSEISDDEYLEFYRHVTHDFADPLTWSHNKVEGKREYTSLLYLPSVAPMDLWNREAPRGVKLYVQRVFITDQAAEFLPLYLRFIRGVVDSNDLSLNVSREMLQKDPAISAMRSALTKRALDMLARLADSDPEKYAVCWAQFGSTLKEGLAEDAGNQEKIASLLRFRTTKSDAEDRRLDDYLADLAPQQEKIYYLISESHSAAAASPHLEAFREREIEVLLLADRIDEWALQYLTEYKGTPLKDVSRGELELPSAGDEPEVQVEPDKEQKDLLKRLKRALRDRVEEVRSSNRLRESAACIVLNEQDLGFQMKEMLKAAGQALPETKPDIEVNLEHPLLERLAAEGDQDRFAKLAALVYDQAVLAEGRQLEDPAQFVKSLNELLFES